MRSTPTINDAQSTLFLEWLDRWFEDLQPATFANLVPSPERAAICSADMVIGFCHDGALASDRVGALVQPVRGLFERALAHGVRNFLLAQDTHHPETPEFQSWPVHCLEGSTESQTISELESLPFADLFDIVPKNSLSPALATPLEDWLIARPSIDTFIVLGDCTDLCTYQIAMYFRMRANALDASGHRVIVPSNCVETYDLPHGTALEIGAMPHPGNLLHRLFLYHLALNGCQVVASLD